MVTQVKLSDKNRRTGNTAWLSPAAAAAYELAKQDGMPGNCVADAGRTNAEQWTMYNKYKAGLLVATAAVPGTSKHEKGNALDLNEPARSWLRARPEYGFVKDRVPREKWHFEHDGRILTPKKELILPPAKKAEPKIVMEDDVIVLMRTIDAAEGKGAIFLVQPGKPPRHLTAQEYNLWNRLGYVALGGDFLRVEVDMVANTLG